MKQYPDSYKLLEVRQEGILTQLDAIHQRLLAIADHYESPKEETKEKLVAKIHDIVRKYISPEGRKSFRNNIKL